LVTNHMLSAADEAALVNQAKWPTAARSCEYRGTACARSTPRHCGPCVEYPFTHADGPVPWAKRRPLQAGVRRAVSGRGALDGTGPGSQTHGPCAVCVHRAEHREGRAVAPRQRPGVRTPSARPRRGDWGLRQLVVDEGDAWLQLLYASKLKKCARRERRDARARACASRPRYALRLRAPELRCAAL
jgi:hypothetical protein